MRPPPVRSPTLDLATYEQIAEPGYLEGLPSRSLADVRAMRAECQRVEDGTSLLRRLVQGHLDIVRCEQERRAAGQSPDLASLVAALPHTLAEHLGDGAPVRSRPAASALSDPALTDELDVICDVVRLSHLPDLSAVELAQLADELACLERTVSGRRRVVFDRLDALSAELTGRYRSGAASVDALLQNEAGGRSGAGPGNASGRSDLDHPDRTGPESSRPGER